jgi:hypothetical protein
LRENGIFVMQVVPTVAHASSAARAGVDAIVAEARAALPWLDENLPELGIARLSAEPGGRQ